ncbi:competence regulator inhibitor paratox, partial [Streptococcus agalactiae]
YLSVFTHPDRCIGVRKNGKIFDYVLLHEEVREEEVVTVERVLDVLRKLS